MKKKKKTRSVKKTGLKAVKKPKKTKENQRKRGEAVHVSTRILYKRCAELANLGYKHKEIAKETNRSTSSVSEILTTPYVKEYLKKREKEWKDNLKSGFKK